MFRSNRIAHCPSRRRFLAQSMAGLAGWHILPMENLRLIAEDRPMTMSLATRIEGLLIGTLLGDASGGPIEFQPPEEVQKLPNGPKKWLPHEVLNDTELSRLAKRFHLHGYASLRPLPEPYAHWTHHAPPGTLTDDSRHKMILIYALRKFIDSRKECMTVRDLAQAYLDWTTTPEITKRDGYSTLCRDWLYEYELAARWVLGERDPSKALPLERIWNGLPTCCGQMTFPVLAAIFPGRPRQAYMATYQLAYHDTGWGKDLNASLMAGLAQAFVESPELDQRESSWNAIVEAMRTTDPFRHSSVPWTQRTVDRWLAVADQAIAEAHNSPARLFARLDDEFCLTTKWEAQVPFVAMYAAAKMCRFDPIPSMQLCLEWGHDTDSYAQLLGAFFGALHGPDVFPKELRTTVIERMRLDYGEDLTDWVQLLDGLRQRSERSDIFGWPEP